MSNRRLSLNDIKVPSSTLKELSVDRLQTIQDEESNFNEFFESLDLEDIKKVQTRRVELTNRNKEIAAKSAECEPRFEELKTQLRQKAIEAGELKELYVQKFEELKRLSNQSDSSAVLKDLQKAARDTETSSEELADKFAAGQLEMPVDEWLETLTRQRRLYWLRKVKAEKMDELIRQNQPRPVPRSPRVGQQGQTTPPYLSPIPQQSPTHSLPAHLHSQPPYPVDPRQSSQPPPGPSPVGSLSPYPHPMVSMPHPSMPQGHPFPRAAFTSYQPAPRNTPYYPRQAPPRPPPYAGGGYPQRPPGVGHQAYHSYR